MGRETVTPCIRVVTEVSARLQDKLMCTSNASRISIGILRLTGPGTKRRRQHAPDTQDTRSRMRSPTMMKVRRPRTQISTAMMAATTMIRPTETCQ
jgi:hypothetical protein